MYRITEREIILRKENHIILLKKIAMISMQLKKIDFFRKLILPLFILL